MGKCVLFVVSGFVFTALPANVRVVRKLSIAIVLFEYIDMQEGDSGVINFFMNVGGRGAGAKKKLINIHD